MHSDLRINAIVLAAGRSTRMGQQKLLMPYGDSTLVGSVLENLQRGGVNDIVVVVGTDADAVRDELSGHTVRFVENPDVDRGMLSSVRCGIAAIDNADALMVALGDMPAVNEDVVRTLLARHNRFDDAITIPTYDGRRGHPVVIGCGHRDAILERFDDVGLRGLMQEQAAVIQEVAMNSDGVLIDLDTPEDYERHGGQH